MLTGNLILEGRDQKLEKKMETLSIFLLLYVIGRQNTVIDKVFRRYAHLLEELDRKSIPYLSLTRIMVTQTWLTSASNSSAEQKLPTSDADGKEMQNFPNMSFDPMPRHQCVSISINQKVLGVFKGKKETKLRTYVNLSRSNRANNGLKGYSDVTMVSF